MNLENLITEAAKNNRIAQSQLYALYAPQMSIICLRYIKNIGEAEDRMMIAFKRFFDMLDGFRYESEKETFVFLKTLVVHECIKFLRKGLLMTVPEEEAYDIPDNDDGIGKVTMAEIMTMIKGLPDGYRTVLNLHCFEGYSHGEIANLLNISEASSRSQLYKARCYLNKLLIYKGYKNGKATTE